MTFRLSEFDPHWLHRRAVRQPVPAKDWFRQAIAAKVASQCFETVGDPLASEIYRNEAIYSVAKGLEALAFETAESEQANA